MVSSEGVIKLLKGLNPSKALGPDEIHPRVLNELANKLTPVGLFAYLFQPSLDRGEISKEWRLAKICPLFKKGDMALACNYHPLYKVDRAALGDGQRHQVHMCMGDL